MGKCAGRSLISVRSLYPVNDVSIRLQVLQPGDFILVIPKILRE